VAETKPFIYTHHITPKHVTNLGPSGFEL